MSTPGRTDNVLVLPRGGNPTIDPNNSAGVGFVGHNARMSQTMYNLEVGSRYNFSFATSQAQGFSPTICNFTATLDDVPIYESNGRPPAPASGWAAVSVEATPLSEVQTLELGISCPNGIGRFFNETDYRYQLQYIKVDDVSFRKLD